MKMILENLLIPDEIYDSFVEITPDHLKGLGIKYIFSDIDNTLVTYDDPVPTEKVLSWIENMQNNGITVAFVSNNKKERVELFNKELKLTAYYKARKPLVNKLKKAMKDLGADKNNSLLLGDQLLTDAASGRIAGLYVIIVPPIKDVLTPFFRFKRLIEKPYIRHYKKTHVKEI